MGWLDEEPLTSLKAGLIAFAWKFELDVLQNPNSSWLCEHDHRRRLQGLKPNSKRSRGFTGLDGPDLPHRYEQELEEEWRISMRKEHAAFVEEFDDGFKLERRLTWLKERIKEHKMWLLEELKIAKAYKETVMYKPILTYMVDPVYRQIKKWENEIIHRPKSKKDYQKYRDIPIQRLFKLPDTKETKVNCPVHGEKTPSLHLYSDGHAHCFGCHNTFGNAIDLVIAWKKLKFPEAIDYLKKYL